uniref:MHD domain-containing protein n=1 Tax=Macrostomum lignano TaxID=282301 RepID=A0A1I8F1Z3_9PLAT
YQSPWSSPVTARTVSIQVQAAQVGPEFGVEQRVHGKVQGGVQVVEAVQRRVADDAEVDEDARQEAEVEQHRRRRTTSGQGEAQREPGHRGRPARLCTPDRSIRVVAGVALRAVGWTSRLNCTSGQRGGSCPLFKGASSASAAASAVSAIGVAAFRRRLRRRAARVLLPRGGPRPAGVAAWSGLLRVWRAALSDDLLRRPLHGGHEGEEILAYRPATSAIEHSSSMNVVRDHDAGFQGNHGGGAGEQGGRGGACRRGLSCRAFTTHRKRSTAISTSTAAFQLEGRLGRMRPEMPRSRQLRNSTRKRRLRSRLDRNTSMTCALPTTPNEAEAGRRKMREACAAPGGSSSRCTECSAAVVDHQTVKRSHVLISLRFWRSSRPRSPTRKIHLTLLEIFFQLLGGGYSKNPARGGIHADERDRAKGVPRQDTLSGNNPFRVASLEADDPFLMTASPQAAETPKNVAKSPRRLKAEPTDGEANGFDPLSTIYPESDNSGDEDGGAGVSVSVKIGGGGGDEAAEAEVVPHIQGRRRGLKRKQQQQQQLPPSQKRGEAEESGRRSRLRSRRPPMPPFEPFHPACMGDSWKLFIRMPETKKKLGKQMSKFTSDRWWKDILVRLVWEQERPTLKLFNLEDLENPYPKLQQYDKYGKLHIFKVNLLTYKEMVGVRTEKWSLKNIQNMLAKPKTTDVLDHMPVPVRQEIVKFGSINQHDIRSLMWQIEDLMMRSTVVRDRNKAPVDYVVKEEVCAYVQDEYDEAAVDLQGRIQRQKSRTRVFFTAFVTGMPYVELGLNDKWRYGNEVVKRQDIIPMLHDDWIDMYEPEFHAVVDMDRYNNSHMICFYPLDACRFELMRFRVALRENQELPLQLKCVFSIDQDRVNIRCDVMVPGFFSSHTRCHERTSRSVFPIPEDWVYFFRQEGKFKYNSVHSALRKPGRIKGIERITQMAQGFFPPSIMEANVGVAKYEHLYRAIVWRISKLPEKHHGAYKSHLFTCRLQLGPHDTVPSWEALEPSAQVEFRMPGSTVSGCTIPDDPFASAQPGDATSAGKGGGSAFDPLAAAFGFGSSTSPPPRPPPPSQQQQSQPMSIFQSALPGALSELLGLQDQPTAL